MRNRVAIFLLLGSVAIVARAQIDQPDSLIMLSKESFSVLYNYTRLCPSVVWWPLCSDDIGRGHRPTTSHFTTESALPKPKAKDSWFNRSGYDRGHMCPAADRTKTREVALSTFTMANVAPQTPFLNRVAWFNAEEKTRQIAKRYHKAVVFAGCLWATPVEYSSRVKLISVPDSFFRAVIVPADTTINIYWLFPAAATEPEEMRYRVPRDRFRRALKNRFTKFGFVW